ETDRAVGVAVARGQPIMQWYAHDDVGLASARDIQPVIPQVRGNLVLKEWHNRFRQDNQVGPAIEAAWLERGEFQVIKLALDKCRGLELVRLRYVALDEANDHGIAVWHSPCHMSKKYAGQAC